MTEDEKTLSAIFKHYYEEHPNELEEICSKISDSTIPDKILNKVKNALLHRGGYHPDADQNSDEIATMINSTYTYNKEAFKNTFRSFIYTKSDLLNAFNEPTTAIGYDHINCPHELGTLRIPDGISTIADASYFIRNYEAHVWCEHLIIPRSVTIIGENAFRGLSLGKLTFEHEKDDALKICRGAFSKIQLLTNPKELLFLIKLPPSTVLDERTVNCRNKHYGVFYNTFLFIGDTTYYPKILIPEQLANKYPDNRLDGLNRCILLKKLGIINDNKFPEPEEIKKYFNNNKRIEIYS